MNFRKRTVVYLIVAVLFVYVASYLAWTRIFAWTNPSDRRYWCFFAPPVNISTDELTRYYAKHGESQVRSWYRKEAVPQCIFAPLVALDRACFGRVNTSGHFLCPN